MRRVWRFAALVLTLGFAPAAADAQTFLIPYGGATFGEDAPTEKFTTGASLTFLGDVAGFELDLGYTPDFFDQSDEFELVGDGNVMTLMGNLLVGPRAGQVRPYGAVGLGLIRTQIDETDLFDEISTNDFGFNVGFGVIGLLSDRVGVRGDVRYFRSLQDPEADDDVDVAIGKFDFWRATGGVSFRF
jgi:opacity protein-like surface antigen